MTVCKTETCNNELPEQIGKGGKWVYCKPCARERNILRNRKMRAEKKRATTNFYEIRPSETKEEVISKALKLPSIPFKPNNNLPGYVGAFCANP